VASWKTACCRVRFQLGPDIRDPVLNRQSDRRAGRTEGRDTAFQPADAVLPVGYGRRLVIRNRLLAPFGKLQQRLLPPTGRALQNGGFTLPGLGSTFIDTFCKPPRAGHGCRRSSETGHSRRRLHSLAHQKRISLPWPVINRCPLDTDIITSSTRTLYQNGRDGGAAQAGEYHGPPTVLGSRRHSAVRRGQH